MPWLMSELPRQDFNPRDLLQKLFYNTSWWFFCDLNYLKTISLELRV